MSKIKVTQEIDVYEVNGESAAGIPPLTLRVESHWNRRQLAVLQFQDGPCITVDIDDLKRALDNAGNTGMV